MHTIVRLRAVVLAACAALVVATVVLGLVREPFASLRVASLTQQIGIESILFLYLALLITPLSQVLPPAYRAWLIPARRPLGVAAFGASVVHTAIGFWGELGGFSGIPFLTHDYKVSLLLTTAALLILLVLATTSFDKAISYLSGPRWKWLHRSVYLASYLIILHVLKLGSHYSSVTPLFRLSFVFLSFLLILEALRIDRKLQATRFRTVGFGVVSLLTAGFLSLQLGAIGSGASLSLHDGHDAVKPTAAPEVAHVHYHANFLFYLAGAPYDFSAEKYMEPDTICSVNPNSPSPQSRVHMHDGDGALVHVHSVNVTWADLFANLGFSLNAVSVVTDSGKAYMTDLGHPLIFILNGAQVTNPADRFIEPNDRLLIDFGSALRTEAQAHYAKVPSTAAAQSSHEDPATCSGS